MRQSEAINTTKWVNENKKWYLIIMGASILMFTQAAIMMSVLTLSQGWGLALWPMRGLHCARVDQSAARRNKWEKLTVQGKLIGTDTQILSVCVCVWYCFTGFQYPLKPKIKKYTFSDSESYSQTYQQIPNDMEFFHHVTWCCWKTWWSEYLISSCQRQVISTG